MIDELENEITYELEKLYKINKEIQDDLYFLIKITVVLGIITLFTYFSLSRATLQEI